jgi:hypothetical protein
MKPEEWHFGFGWWGTDLSNILVDVRPRVGTYGRYDFEMLPELPFELKGDFLWLEQAATPDDSIANDRNKFANLDSFFDLKEFCQKNAISLPESFVRFLESPLRDKVRSNTDCYLSVCPEAIVSPLGDGYLIRFLADSQGCIFWYLFLSKNCKDHAVLSSPAFYGTKEESPEDGEQDPNDLVFNAGSFEEFMCRYWLENEIWFADYEETQMPEAGEIYLQAYRAQSQIQ